MTNRDKIKSMDNAELAKVLCQSKEFDKCNYCSYLTSDTLYCHKESCFEGIKTWLDAPCKENSPADNPQEAIPAEVRVDLRKVAKEIVGECKEHYPNGCEDCRYGDSIGLCCFKQEPPTWDLGTANEATPPDMVNLPTTLWRFKDKNGVIDLDQAARYIEFLKEAQKNDL